MVLAGDMGWRFTCSGASLAHTGSEGSCVTASSDMGKQSIAAGSAHIKAPTFYCAMLRARAITKRTRVLYMLT
jgi:hypothetical protein